jgi:signal transduction histidine kinase/DNA-binding response OmpR family regulator
METEKETRKLEIVVQKIEKERIRGIKFSIMGIPLWVVCYLAYFIMCDAFGVTPEMSAFSFLVIPVTLTLLVTLFIYSPIPAKLGIPPKYYPYFALILHNIVLLYLNSRMSDQFNGYFVLFGTLNGLLFVNHTAGTLMSLLLSLGSGSTYFIMNHFYEVPFGADEEVFLFFFITTSITISMINGFSKKRRQQFYSVKKEVEKQHTELKRMDEFKTRFFKNVSHELRTPLTLIINYLSELSATQKSNQLISTSLQSSYKLYYLINQLLDFQRLSKGSKEETHACVDLSHYILAAAPFLEAACKKKNIRFDAIVSDTKPSLVKGSVENMEKIIFGLVANSIKHTEEQKSITVSIQKIEKTNRLLISVKDNGKGYSKESVEKFLQDFSNINDSSPGYSSIDLGITLVKELVEEMNGSIAIKSEPGKGAEFIIKLPLTDGRKEICDILIVDDEENVHTLLEKLLAEQLPDVTYKKAYNAKEARQLLDQFKFKCIICDVFLPGENGVDFLKYVSKSHPGTTRTLLTGHADSDIVKNAVNEFIADLVFYKPWRDSEIVILIKKAREVSKITDDESFDYSDYKPKDWHLGMLTEAVNFSEDKIIRKRELKKNSDLVLVVESQTDMRDYIVHTLQKNNFTAIAAGDIKHGVNQAKSHKPDIIIVDWVMNDQSGPQFIEELNKDKLLSTIPTILLTAQGDAESELIEKESHANAYLGKPFNELELKSIVKNLIELDRVNKELTTMKSKVNL